MTIIVMGVLQSCYTRSGRAQRCLTRASAGPQPGAAGFLAPDRARLDAAGRQQLGRLHDYAFWNSTMRFELVPSLLFDTPQIFAVLVKR